MTTVENITPILPGSAHWTELLERIATGAENRDLNDVNPFDQVAQLKRAGFGALRLPANLGGADFSVPRLFAAVIDVVRTDQIVAHIFRTHIWLVEERLRASTEPASRGWLRKVADGRIFGNAFSEKGSLAVGSRVFQHSTADRS